MSLLQRPISPIAAFAVIYAAVSLTITNSYYQLIMTLVLVWAVFGLSWNLLSGYTGLISFGHAAFFGIGAYTTALGQIYFDLSPWLSIPIAAMLGGLAGFLVGFPTFRLQGHYFALAMLAYPLAILYVFEWLGFQEVTLPIKRDNPIAYMQFSDPRLYTLLALAMLIGTILLTRAVERAGSAWRCLRSSRTRRRRKPPESIRWPGSFARSVLSGAIAGAIGAFYAVVLLVVTPQSVFGMLVSAQALDGRDVRRRRHGLGTGDRKRDPDSSGRNAQCGSGNALPRHSGRDLRARDRLRDTARTGRAVLESFAISGAGVSCHSRHPSRWMHRRRQRSRSCPVSMRRDRPAGAGGCHPRGPQSVALFRWPQGGPERQLQASAQRNSRHHRPQRRRQDHVVQSAERLPAAGSAAKFCSRAATCSARKPHELCEAGVARTFQIMRPFLRMSISDNVVVGAYVRSRTDTEARQTGGGRDRARRPFADRRIASPANSRPRSCG